MNLLHEIENLMKVDPEGWVSEYDGRIGGGKLRKLSYRDRIQFQILYSANELFRWITIYPAAVELGWWDRRRFDQMVRRLVGYKTQSLSRAAAQKILDARNQEIEEAMRELDSGLAAQFAELEANDRKERQKQLEAPVVNGFLRGAQKRLKGVKE